MLYLLPTTPHLYTVMLGSLAAGVSCCINWMLEPAHWAALIKSSRAKVVVALGPTPGYEIWEKLQTIRADIPAGVTVLSVQALGGAAARGLRLRRSGIEAAGRRAHLHAQGETRATSPPMSIPAARPDRRSSSDSRTKGFSYKFWANTLVMAHTADDVIFSDYPMFHIAGFFGRGIMAIADGMEIVIPSPSGARDKRFIENYWKFVEKFRISILSGRADHAGAAQQDAAATARTCPRCGPMASPARPRFRRRSRASSKKSAACGCSASYGATEYTQNVAQPPRDGDPRYGSAGLRLPYTQIKIVEIDDGGHIKRECAADEIGLVVVKGPSVTPGYVDEAANKGVLLPDGWFNSGDLGRIDPDGFLWITGRAKDVIIRGGHNIDPTVIEETLLKHPDVVLAAAVSKPDSYAGELPIAYVQLVPNAKATADEVQAFAQANSPERAAAPKEIILLDKMPLTDVGKPAKVQLRLDAARRAFTAALADVAGGGNVSVDMIADPKQGNRAVIQIDNGAGNARQEIESRIQERMKYYATPYEISWHERAAPLTGSRRMR